MKPFASALPFLMCLLASCSDGGEVTAELRRVQSRAEAVTGGDVELTQAWKTANGELCGVLVAETPHGRDYGAFEVSPDRVVVETESETGFGHISDACTRRRGTIDVAQAPVSG